MLELLGAGKMLADVETATVQGSRRSAPCAGVAWRKGERRGPWGDRADRADVVRFVRATHAPGLERVHHPSLTTAPGGFSAAVSWTLAMRRPEVSVLAR
jgi:hypothetical protein